MSHKIGDVPPGRSVENNTLVRLLFDPTEEQIVAMASEVFCLEFFAVYSLDAALMVLMKAVLEVDTP